MQSEHKKTACVLKGSHIAHGLWLQTQRLARSIWSLRGVACIAKRPGKLETKGILHFPPSLLRKFLSVRAVIKNLEQLHKKWGKRESLIGHSCTGSGACVFYP